jgi:hypothetical protein
VEKIEGHRQGPAYRWHNSYCSATAQVHWYEAHGIGRKELKIKFPLLD